MVSLVTGAGGFVGSRLVEHLAALGDTVWAISRRELPSLPSGVKLAKGNILDVPFINGVVSSSKPDRIFHLAAQSFPGESWKDPAGTFRANVDGTVNLLEAVRAAGAKPVIVVAGSSAEYAPATDAQPIREDGYLRPSSPYGVSKLAEDHLAALYGAKYELKVVRARPFFLIGPRKTGDVCSDFARGIVAIERGKARTLKVGNKQVVRDFLSVEDGVDALVVLSEKGRGGDAYNICCGSGYRIGDVLEIYRKMARAPFVDVADPALMRPVEEMAKVGDPAKLRSLGWKPSRSIEDTLETILNYWRDAEPGP